MYQNSDIYSRKIQDIENKLRQQKDKDNYRQEFEEFINYQKSTQAQPNIMDDEQITVSQQVPNLQRIDKDEVLINMHIQQQIKKYNQSKQQKQTQEQMEKNKVKQQVWEQLFKKPPIQKQQQQLPQQQQQEIDIPITEKYKSQLMQIPKTYENAEFDTFGHDMTDSDMEQAIIQKYIQSQTQSKVQNMVESASFKQPQIDQKRSSLTNNSVKQNFINKSGVSSQYQSKLSEPTQSIANSNQFNNNEFKKQSQVSNQFSNNDSKKQTIANSNQFNNNNNESKKQSILNSNFMVNNDSKKQSIANLSVNNESRQINKFSQIKDQPSTISDLAESAHFKQNLATKVTNESQCQSKVHQPSQVQQPSQKEQQPPQKEQLPPQAISNQSKIAAPMKESDLMTLSELHYQQQQFDEDEEDSWQQNNQREYRDYISNSNYPQEQSNRSNLLPKSQYSQKPLMFDQDNDIEEMQISEDEEEIKNFSNVSNDKIKNFSNVSNDLMLTKSLEENKMLFTTTGKFQEEMLRSRQPIKDKQIEQYDEEEEEEDVDLNDRLDEKTLHQIQEQEEEETVSNISKHKFVQQDFIFIVIKYRFEIAFNDNQNAGDKFDQFRKKKMEEMERQKQERLQRREELKQTPKRENSPLMPSASIKNKKENNSKKELFQLQQNPQANPHANNFQQFQQFQQQQNPPPNNFQRDNHFKIQQQQDQLIQPYKDIKENNRFPEQGGLRIQEHKQQKNIFVQESSVPVTPPPMPKNQKKKTVESPFNEQRSNSVKGGFRSTSQQKKREKKTNKLNLKNAITNVCLAGEPNRKEREIVLNQLEQIEAEHYLILFKGSYGRMDFKGLYGMNGIDLEPQLLFSQGKAPQVIDSNQVLQYFKYDSGSKEFKVIKGNKQFSFVVDAVQLRK